MDAPFRSIPGFSAFGEDDPVAAQDPGAADSGLPPDLGPQQQSPPSYAAPGVAQQSPAPLMTLPAPVPAAPASARRRAGAAIVLAGVGIGTGALLGGAWGAGSGLLFAGAAMNALRARSLWTSPDPTARGEAIKTTAMLVIGLAGAGYLGYRAHQSRESR